MSPRGKRAEPGMPTNGRRMINVKEPALWDWAIKRAAERRISLSQFIETLFRNQMEREDKQW